MDVQPEELDLDALLSGGPITGKAPAGNLHPPRLRRMVRVESVDVVMDAELIDDTSSWSESDDVDMSEDAVVEEKEEEESSDDVETAKTLVDPLGIHGELTAAMKYDARLDPMR